MDDPMLTLEGDRRQGKVEKRALLEKDIESAVCRYGRNQGLLVEKFVSPGRRSVPDDMFSKHNGEVFFIEFKAPGKKPTMKQLKDHETRRAMGFRVYVVDDIVKGKEIIDMELL